MIPNEIIDKYFESEDYKLFEKIEGFYWNLDRYLHVGLLSDINMGFVVNVRGGCFYVKPNDLKNKTDKEIKKCLLHLYKEFLVDFQKRITVKIVDIDAKLEAK